MFDDLPDVAKEEKRGKQLCHDSAEVGKDESPDRMTLDVIPRKQN